MKQLKLNANTFGDEEIASITDVLKSGHMTMGQETAAFEDEFARYLGVGNAVMVNSGSSANLLAFFALANPLLTDRRERPGLGPGDEVIVPALTWPTTIWPIIQAGAVPVLVDSDPETLQMNLDEITAATGPKTRAICAVHVLGNAVDTDGLRALADEHDLWLIEDTCEALGVRNRGRLAGTSGDFGTFSFYFSHHITTIEGGMVVTDDDDLADLIRCLRAHGWARDMKKGAALAESHPEIDSRFLFVNAGFNVRPTDINATCGRIQLKKLESFNEYRNRVAGQFIDGLDELASLGRLKPMRITEGTEPAWFGFPVLCEDHDLRDGLSEHLETHGIETRPVICGNMARQPGIRHFPHRIVGTLAGADRVMDCGLYWGIHPLITDDEITHVIEIVKGFFGT